MFKILVRGAFLICAISLAGCLGELEVTCKSDPNCAFIQDTFGAADTTSWDIRTSDACQGDACAQALACDPGFHECAGACVSDTSVETCGQRCEPCPGAPGAEAVCLAAACALECQSPGSWDEASGTCVECTEEDASACDGYACDPATHQCTQILRGSLLACRACVSDTECKEGFACVPMDFKGSPLNKTFCLPIAAPDCERPYPNRVTRRSASGVEGDFCTLNEALTTCEAITQFGQTGCMDASDCGATGYADSLCEPIDFETNSVCTIPCTTTDECPTSVMIGCAPSGSGDYCGAF